MMPEHWARIEHLYHAALDHQPSERAAFLEQACSDAALRREVASLLEHHEKARNFLETRGLTVSYRPGPHDGGRQHLPSPGDRFGGYGIGPLLGAGGMGVVYEAVELETGRRVALKLLLQSLTEPADRARFLREGRLAASISHRHTIYVYGTEEIDGIPVISMELTPAGTLRDRVNATGPMQPSAAVDAIEQVIAGLEVAAGAGILHRDVKPSNCFVDSDGCVKIGDFGLSISTLARHEGDLSTSGATRATPAFASPEQLRGDELDVRSDIYSVGATLYFLLTGRAPFAADSLIKLVTKVIEETPPSPCQFQSRIPQRLARVVMRCLAKDPAARFPSYKALTDALRPFDSSASTPATLQLRLLAWVLDLGMLSLLSFPFSPFFFSTPLFQPAGRLEWLVATVPWRVLPVFYYAALEGYWGASIGKALCGLRVVTYEGEIPGFIRALLRSFLYHLLFDAPQTAIMLIGPQFFLTRWAVWTALPVKAATAAIVFSTARRANGLAALHDLASRTRVTQAKAAASRAPGRTSRQSVRAPVSAPRFGPYRAVHPPVSDVQEQIVLGDDDRLDRNVWIHVLRAGSPAVTPARRDVNRPARLRWLTGKRSAEECWDAYEAADGLPLIDVLDRAHPWSVVRLWLRELAEEATASLQDHTLPEIGLDRVWITEAGHVKLLDWAAPSAACERSRPAVTPLNLETLQQLLHHVAASALKGASAEVPLPLGATAFLKNLGQKAFTAPSPLLDALDVLIRRPAVVSRRRRLLHLTFCSVLPILLVTGVIRATRALQRSPESDPFRWDLYSCLADLDRLERTTAVHLLSPRGQLNAAQERRTLEVYIVKLAREHSWDESIWSQYPMLWNPQLRIVAERALAAHPNPSQEDLDLAAKAIAPRLARARRDASPEGVRLLVVAAGVTAIGYLFVAMLSLFSAALFRGGLVFRWLGIAVVTPGGGEASRPRVLVRAGIAWSPVLIPLLVRFGALGPIWLALFALACCLVLAGAVCAVLRPERGLQDSLAGTFLVPR